MEFYGLIRVQIAKKETPVLTVLYGCNEFRK